MGCGVSAPSLVGEFESRYADVIISSKNVLVVAKRFLEKVATVRYDNTYSKRPTMVGEEDVVLVDNSRIGVYKGDQVNINTADKMYEVEQLSSTYNGVELHVVLKPQGDLSETFVIGWDAERSEFSVRHDDPLKTAELARAITPSTEAGGWSVPSSPYSSVTSTGIDFFEPELVQSKEKPPEVSSMQLHNARLYRRLSEDLQKFDFQKLELESVTSSMPGSVGTPDGNEINEPVEQANLQKAPLQKQVLQRRHSMAGHEGELHPHSPDGPVPTFRHRRHSVSCAEGAPHQEMVHQLDANLNPKSSQRQRRPSFSGVDGKPLDVHYEQSSSHHHRRHSESNLENPNRVVRFATDDARQSSERQRRRSIA